MSKMQCIQGNFEFCLLTGVQLSQALLTDSNFSHANLSGGNCSHADFSGANFHRITDTGTCWDGSLRKGVRDTHEQLRAAEDWRSPLHSQTA